MSPRIKKVVAREFLIFIIPILAIILFVLCARLYWHLKMTRLENRQSEAYIALADNLIEIADSVYAADSVEVVRRMRMGNEIDADMALAHEEWKRTYRTQRFNVAKNVFGDLVHPPGKALVDANAIAERELNEGNDAYQEFFNSLVGNGVYDGVLSVVYLVWLLLAYPIRFTILAITWAVRMARS